MSQFLAAFFICTFGSIFWRIENLFTFGFELYLSSKPHNLNFLSLSYNLQGLLVHLDKQSLRRTAHCICANLSLNCATINNFVLYLVQHDYLPILYISLDQVIEIFVCHCQYVIQNTVEYCCGLLRIYTHCLYLILNTQETSHFY